MPRRQTYSRRAAIPPELKAALDAGRYVQLSVANWLNDASKHRPGWVREVTERWLAGSGANVPAAETRWIVNHALRTLRKVAT